MKKYTDTQTKYDYKKEYTDKTTQEKKIKIQQLPLTVIIRHQIHHPENKKNDDYTEEQLRTSIEEMRKFIQAQSSKVDQPD